MNVVTPRFTTVWGKDETMQPLASYRKLPRPIPIILAALKAHVEALCGAKFNFVLCNVVTLLYTVLSMSDLWS